MGVQYIPKETAIEVIKVIGFIFWIMLIYSGNTMATKDRPPALEMVTYYHKEEKITKTLENLLDRPVESLIGKKFLEKSFTMGTYGMGGPGFVGLLLEHPNGAKEWMVFTVWAADWSILMNDQWVGAHPMFYHKQKPLYSKIRSKGKLLEWDEFSPKIIGGTIVKAHLSDKSFILDIEFNGETHKLEFLDEDPRLPPMPLGGDRKTMKDGDKIGKYIVFHEDGGILDTVENKKK